MGTVYDAIDREHGTRVALKRLTELDAASLARFKTEFRAVADLAHPNLVPLYELSSDDGVWFITMERIDGVDFVEHLRGPSTREASTLEEAIANDATTQPRGSDRELPSVIAAIPSLPLELPRVRDAFAQLVRGVHALHQAGLLHLDLKPSNVLVDRNGRVVVLDFGLVRAIREAHDPSTPGDSISVSGTPAWMAPEQFAGDGVAEPADWYSVGLMLYRVLTGIPAFPPASAAVTWFARLHLPPTPPHELLGMVPRDLSMLAMDLLAADPAMRPRGAALLSFFSGEGNARTSAERVVRTTLVGRAKERAALRDVVRRVRAGSAAIVHLVGPSGVGKSALLGALRSSMHDDGDAMVVRGRCYERESVPYKAFDGIIDALARRLAISPEAEVERLLPPWSVELARTFPVLGSVPSIARRMERALGQPVLAPMEQRRRVLEALCDLFANLATRRPLLLEIDDLQWADADSVALLSKLIEAPMPRGLVIAASLRPVEARASAIVSRHLEAIATLGTRGDVVAVTLEIAPMPKDDAEALARLTLAEHDLDSDRLAAAIAVESAGVPYFVEELAHFAAQQRTEGREVSTAGVTLDGVLAARLAAVSEGERALVEVLAVANSPVPLSVSFAVAGIETGALRALWSLRGGHFVHATGAATTDRIELHHDRMRESVIAAMPAARLQQHRLALGRALAALGPESPWLFDAVRHLDGVVDRLEASERTMLARLNLAAGRSARRSAAFPLALDRYRAAASMLTDASWDTDYTLALAVHSGAAEAAYLDASWTELGAHVAIVKARARTLFDQLSVREVEIDACIARTAYDDAVRAALEVLRLLGAELPSDPTGPDVEREVVEAMSALGTIGEGGLAALPDAADPVAMAVMRIESRISSAAYFARPMLLPVLACRLVRTSIEKGLSPATPYALAVYGIVLVSIGMLRDAHRWGRVALSLLDRFEDRSHEARTRHVVHDLVGTWTVPLRSTLDDLRAVVEIGRETGDLEYAAYAAHAYVHNAFYAGVALQTLQSDAQALGAFIRRHEQSSALHVHTPFERLIACFVGNANDPSTLDGDGFVESVALAEARSAGSRSAQCLLPLLMGIARYHFGSIADASAHLEAARPFADGVVATWHVPMLHQYAALAIWGLPSDARSGLEERAEASRAVLAKLATEGPENFAHRVALIEGERARALGDHALAKERFAAAIAGAEAGAFWLDLGLAHELAARSNGDAKHLDGARAAYERAGARAKLARLG
jgi:predicted ATPase